MQHVAATRMIISQLADHTGNAVTLALSSGHSIRGTLDAVSETTVTVTDGDGAAWRIHPSNVIAAGIGANP